MIKRYILFLTFFLALSCIKAQEMLRKELLGRPTNNSITVQTIFSDSVAISIQYGISSGVYDNQTNWQLFAGNESAEVLIPNLLSNTKYFYRLSWKNPNATLVNIRPEYSFQTARAENSSFTFVVQADPHLDIQSDTAIYNRCLQNQLEDNPDFMIDLGDFLMTDKLKNASNIIPRDTITYRCNLLREYYEKIGHSVPLFIALGNHEGEAGWNLSNTANNIAVWGTLDRKEFFLNPFPNDFYSGDTTSYQYVGQRASYYSWNWGDAQFIVLDPYWFTETKPDSLHGWRWTLGLVQYNWLKSTLENSNAKYKFVFAHQLVGGDPDGRGGVEFADFYEWGGKNLDGSEGFSENRPGWYKPIKDLLTENRVNIFFHGHDHFFGKQEKDCMIYQETPQPSHPNFSNTNLATDYGYLNGQFLPNSGHIRVNVNGENIKVEYVRAYKAEDESPTRQNKDVSATFFINLVNCYDSLNTGVPTLWNANYSNEIAFPNPFSEQIKIEFSLKLQERLWIDIRDENGKIVRNLVNGNIVPKGNFHIFWDGTSSHNTKLNSGKYYYKISGSISGNRTGIILLNK